MGKTATDNHFSGGVAHSIQPGVLDGFTIMRHGPFYRERSNGGVEQCLRSLNRGLLHRHRLTLLQVHRVHDLRKSGVEVEQVGLGRLLWIPVAYQKTTSKFADLPKRARFIYDQTIAPAHQNSDAKNKLAINTATIVLRQELRHLPHRSVILSDPLSSILLSYKVDLLAVHGLTYDATSLIQQARRADIPFVLVNHFYNVLFSEPQVRRWIADAAGIGAVSARDMPDHVRTRCVTLLDAVDTDLFSPCKARLGLCAERPTILLPALIKPGKGHEDLLRAGRILANKNLDFQICFAGWAESEPLHQSLREQVAAAGLGNQVVFLGELGQEQIRDHYGLCSLVVLPTYCEGLPRTLLEAQAMQKPVVAYDSGGVAETMLPNKSGFLVKTGDVEGLADRIGFLLTNEAERQRMAARGREFVVENFSVSALIQRHEAFYLRALRKRMSAKIGGDFNKDAR